MVSGQHKGLTAEIGECALGVLGGEAFNRKERKGRRKERKGIS